MRERVRTTGPVPTESTLLFADDVVRVPEDSLQPVVVCDLATQSETVVNADAAVQSDLSVPLDLAPSTYSPSELDLMPVYSIELPDTGPPCVCSFKEDQVHFAFRWPPRAPPNARCHVLALPAPVRDGMFRVLGHALPEEQSRIDTAFPGTTSSAQRQLVFDSAD